MLGVEHHGLSVRLGRSAATEVYATLVQVEHGVAHKGNVQATYHGNYAVKVNKYICVVL